MAKKLPERRAGAKHLKPQNRACVQQDLLRTVYRSGIGGARLLEPLGPGITRHWLGRSLAPPSNRPRLRHYLELHDVIHLRRKLLDLVRREAFKWNCWFNRT